MALKNVEKQEKSIVALTVEIPAEQIEAGKEKHLRKTARKSPFQVSVRVKLLVS